MAPPPPPSPPPSGGGGGGGEGQGVKKIPKKRAPKKSAVVHYLSDVVQSFIKAELEKHMAGSN